MALVNAGARAMRLKDVSQASFEQGGSTVQLGRNGFEGLLASGLLIS